ncbi:hypothetical protein [Duganella sp. Dugasp56]|uniref:hypothetical protein n=1 Tax=Duganella sp. Dugasp56 TaxID=3243046 RepID=UPI0039AF09F6
MKNCYRTVLALAIAAGLAAYGGATQAANVYHLDSINGSDSNDGLTEATAWQNLYKLNLKTLAPGDSVLFKRGGQWRGSLQMQGGTLTGGVVTYGAYGVGNKPRLLGSAPLNALADWVQTSTGSQIWASQLVTISSEKLSNTDFSTNVSGWSVYSPHGIITSVARDLATYFPQEAPPSATTASAKVTFNSFQGTDQTSDAMLYAGVGQVTAGKCYKFSFHAMASAPFAPKAAIAILVQNTSPGTTVGILKNAPAMWTIGTTWDNYDVLFQAITTVPDGRVAFALGGAGAAGSTLNIDGLSFKEFDCDRALTADVGNLIFDGEASVGVKVLNEADLDQDGKFWFDPKKMQVKLRSYQNPATLHSQIEAAQGNTIVSIKKNASNTDLLVQDLDLRYGGAHGVGLGGVKRITFDRLDLSYIGGSLLDPLTRYGNGIQFWLAADTVTVRNSRLSQIYDSALTAQGQGVSIVNGVTFANNYVLNAEQCFELWNQGGSVGSSTTGVTFSHNTCVGSGRGWSHAQRKNKEGADVLMYAATSPMRNIAITDNVFFNPINSLVRIDLPWDGYRSIDFSRNCFYPDPNPLPDAGWLLKETGNIDGIAHPLTTTSPSVFVSEFSTAATPASYYGDPQLLPSPSGELVPAAGGACEGKGYVPVAGN